MFRVHRAFVSFLIALGLAVVPASALADPYGPKPS
jgi:hypothetical protein